jgi:hypothetical protein
MVVTAPYVYTSQGLRVPSVTIENQSQIFAVASSAQQTMLGPSYFNDPVGVPAGTTRTLLQPSAAVFAPYETVDLTVDVAGIVDGATRYFAHFEFNFPSGISGDMPYWANP